MPRTNPAHHIFGFGGVLFLDPYFSSRGGRWLGELGFVDLFWMALGVGAFFLVLRLTNFDSQFGEKRGYTHMTLALSTMFLVSYVGVFHLTGTAQLMDVIIYGVFANLIPAIIGGALGILAVSNVHMKN